MQKASIRRAQDKFMYLIWNHKPRPPRKSGDKEKTKVQICLPEPIGLKTFIEATLADVSDGPENRRGIGIRLRTSGWILKENIYKRDYNNISFKATCKETKQGID